MATVNLELSVRSHDYLGVHASNVYYFTADDAATIAAAISDAQELVVLQDLISGAEIDECRLSVVFQPSGGKSSPEANTEVEMTALYNFAQSGSSYKFGVDIPGPAAATVSFGKINLSNVDVDAFIAWLTSAHTTLRSVSKYLLALNSFLDVLLSFRKHRKQETRRSLETNG